MISVQLTDAEVKVLYTLITNQRSRISFLKRCFDINVTENVKELNSLSKKVKKIKTAQPPAKKK